MSFTPTMRSANLGLMGLSSGLARKVTERIDKIQEKDRRNKEGKSQLLEAITENADAGQVFCPSDELPQRYAAMAFLVRDQDEMRTITSQSQLQAGLTLGEWYDASSVGAVYEKLEKTKNRLPDATAVGVAAVLLKSEDELLLGAGEWAMGGLMGGVSVDGILASKPAVEVPLVEYFALMHYMTELANDPASKFCAGGDAPGGGP
jgi:hypothetical protein